MISKKLLSKVLDLDIYKCQFANPRVTAYFESAEQKKPMFINIYELANKCKLWAFNQKFPYCITSRIIDDGKGMWEAETGYGFGVPSSVDFIADSEPEAIFKACEWILKEQE